MSNEISRVPGGLSQATASQGTLSLERSEESANKDPRNQKVLKAAQMYESHFLGEMVRAMRKTVPESEFNEPNMAEKMYREQLDDQYVESWVDQGGIGLGDLIYDQIMERFSNMVPAGNRSQGMAMPGPDGKLHAEKKSVGFPMEKPALPLKTTDDVKLIPMTPPSSSEKNLTFKIERAPAPGRPQISGKAEPVVSPWSGRITSKQNLSGDLTAVQIEHDNGMNSTMVISGLLAPIPVGQPIEGGQTIATLSPSASSIVWSLRSRS